MWKIAAWALFFAGLIGGAEWYVHTRVEQGKTELRAQQLERDLKEEKEVSRQMQGVIDYADRKSKDDVAAAKLVADRLAAVEKRLGNTLKTDPAAAAWYSAPVPESIRRLRRDAFPGAAEIGRVRDPDSKAPADPRATAERRDERINDAGVQPVPAGPAVVQPGQKDNAGNTDVPKPVEDSIVERINKLKKGLKP